MQFATWAVVVGLLLVLMALSGSILARLPLSTAMLYLMAGVAVGPMGLGLLTANPHEHTLLLERVTELVLLVSLFTAGLKLSPGLRDKRWLLPLRLALLAMVLTIAGVALALHLIFGWGWGLCILAAAMLSPTDPVLASDVQVQHPGDRDRLRFSLTGEGGLNDGASLPFVLLGLGLMGLRDNGAFALHWFAIDVLWGAIAGPAVGASLGIAIGRLVLYLRREHKEAVGLDDFLAMGLIGLAYGVAQWLGANGFLSVFAAGLALRYLEQSQTPEGAKLEKVDTARASADRSVADAIAVDPDHAPAFMAQAVLGFNEQLERIGEVAVVMTIGAILWIVKWDNAFWLFIPLLLLVIRPLAVALGLLRSHTSKRQRLLVAWFGIRGVGSVYYLMYAINHGVPSQHVDALTSLTLSVVVASIVLHGISVTPLMAAYERAMKRRRS